MRLSVADRRFQLSLMIVFGCAAALLAALERYGVVWYSVARRRRELGIRIALGASPTDIHRLVIGEGLAPVRPGARDRPVPLLGARPRDCQPAL